MVGVNFFFFRGWEAFNGIIEGKNGEWGDFFLHHIISQFGTKINLI